MPRKTIAKQSQRKMVTVKQKRTKAGVCLGDSGGIAATDSAPE
jgi:hypothetical protein